MIHQNDSKRFEKCQLNRRASLRTRSPDRGPPGRVITEEKCQRMAPSEAGKIYTTRPWLVSCCISLSWKSVILTVSTIICMHNLPIIEYSLCSFHLEHSIFLSLFLIYVFIHVVRTKCYGGKGLIDNFLGGWAGGCVSFRSTYRDKFYHNSSSLQ